jgi:hypothetical protein
LPGDSLKECKQLLFHDKILVDPTGIVYTPKMSTIYSLQEAKSDSKVAKNANMVELIQKNWHQIEPELGRWRDIIATPWNRYKQSNRHVIHDTL